ncbi:MAG: hypothetical protein IJD35_07115 [Clostridia bacterium]|nr:hypothetical protein [Clostridia bacterium]
MPLPKDKEKFALWVRPTTMQGVRENYREDNCRSQSEFIENAILFYLGYLTADKPKSFLPSMFLSTMKGIVAESDNRTSGLLFKIAVELAILQNLIAATNEVDELTMTKLRGECIKEVKKIHGIFTMEKAMDWQSE